MGSPDSGLVYEVFEVSVPFVIARSRSDAAIPLYGSTNEFMRKFQYYVYIMTNKTNNVLYTGVTNSLSRRGYEHKTKQSLYDSFTKKYNINKLVYYEIYNDISTAIAREKQIKAGSRKKKVELIKSINPTWKDLYDEILFD